LHLLSSIRADIQDRLFLLIGKGKELFHSRELTVAPAFTELASPFLEGSLLPMSTQRELRCMCDSFLTPSDAGFLELKSYVHAFADVPRHGRRCPLRRDTLKYLEEACPQIIKNLPGYEPAPPARGPMLRFVVDPWPRHSDHLDSLFDQTIFQKFRFVQLA